MRLLDFVETCYFSELQNDKEMRRECGRECIKMTKREIKQYHQTNCKHGQKQISKEGIRSKIEDGLGYGDV